MASLGFIAREKYLEANSQEYGVVEELNRVLGKPENGLRALLFVRHLYYVDVPYLNGDPGTSFELDVEHLPTAEDWKLFFAQKAHRICGTGPPVPGAIAGPLEQLEKEGQLVPIARAEVANSQGKRVDQRLVTTPVVILDVKVAESPQCAKPTKGPQ